MNSKKDANVMKLSRKTKLYYKDRSEDKYAKKCRTHRRNEEMAEMLAEMTRNRNDTKLNKL
jgi:hypothetical protein